MKAPDKIYLQEGVKAPFETWTYRECPAYKNIEYIRKDALLELLKPEKDISFCDDYERGCIDGRNSLREELLDKLNAL